MFAIPWIIGKSSDQNGTDVELIKSNLSSIGADHVDVYLYFFLSFQLAITAVGVLSNLILFYAQFHVANLPFYQRVLFLNVTGAAVVSCAVHFGQSCEQLASYHLFGDGQMAGSISDCVGDGGIVAVAVGMVAMAFQNLIALRECNKQQIRSPEKKRSAAKKTRLTVLITLGIWIAAAAVILGGLNPQAQVYQEESIASIKSYISITMDLIVQLSVGCAILATHLNVKKLQADFEIRRAQQNLRVRLHISETIALTGAIFKVLILHSITWIVSIAVAIGLSHKLSVEIKYSMERLIDYENLVSALTSVVDCTLLIFNALYPFVISWKQSTLQRHMKKCLNLCGNRFKIEPCDLIPDPIVKYTNPNPKQWTIFEATEEAQVHHSAIEGHWEKVARANHI